MEDKITNRLLELYPNILSFSRTQIDEVLRMLIDEEYKSFNYLKYADLRLSLENNLYLFSAAKTYNIMQELKIIKLLEIEDFKTNIKNLAKNEFNKINVECDLIDRISNYSNTLYGTTKMLMNITQEDEKVRDWHRNYNRVTLPSNDPFWTTTALKIYGSWNDRCRCIVVTDYNKDDLAHSRKVIQDNKNNKQLQKEIKDANKRNENDVIINIRDKKVNCFYQNSLIDNMPPILRKKYKK